jgi:hypothetical protein
MYIDAYNPALLHSVLYILHVMHIVNMQNVQDLQVVLQYSLDIIWHIDAYHFLSPTLPAQPVRIHPTHHHLKGSTLLLLSSAPAHMLPTRFHSKKHEGRRDWLSS